MFVFFSGGIDMCLVDVKVEAHYGSYLVKFPERKTLLLQSDYDQASFACDCGLIKEPNPDLLINVNLCDIDKAPAHWLDAVE